VFGLEDGEYVVSAAADTMVSKGQDSPPPTYVETFYPSSTTIDEATRVQLKPGQDLDGIEITLIRTKVYRMSGTIFGPDGQPAGRVTASLLHVGGNGQEIRVDAAGRFAASGLMPGTYDVSASGSSDGGARIFGRTRFTIADADVSDLIVTTNPGVDVRGRVVVSQEKGLPPPNVQVETTRVDADGKSSWIPARTPLNPDASFVLRWLFGPTIVRVRPTPPGWMLKAVLLNGEDITDKPVEFRDQDSGHLEVVLTRRASVVEGSVKDTRDRPVDDYAVVLFSSNRNDWIPDSTRTQVTYPRSDARFRFDHVRAGRYWMVAIPRDRAGGWVYLSSDLERLVDDATDVVVGDDDRRSFDLKLVTPGE
jgi:hypothetical protein